MKKNILMLLLLALSFSGFSQSYFTNLFRNKIEGDTISINNWLLYQGDTILYPTYTNARNFQIKNLDDPTDSLDAVNLRYFNGNAAATSTFVSNTDTPSDYIDQAGKLTKVNAGETAIEFISLSEIDVGDFNDDSTYLTPADTINLSNEIDSLTSDLSDLTNTVTAVESSIMKTVYRVTLPVNGTLSGSAAAATDLPAGWSLSVSGGDLQINHGLGRYSAGVNISYNTSGDSYRHLRNFDNAYSGYVDVDNNNLTIESISTFYTAYALRIKIFFE